MATSTARSATWAPPGPDAPTKNQLAAWVAWGSCALYWAAISLGYALVLSHGTARSIYDELGWRIGYGSFATVGAFIASRRPGNVLGWILCAVGLASAVAGFAQDYASYALLGRKEWLPGGLVMGWLGSWPWYIAFGLILTYLVCCSPTAGCRRRAGARSPGQQPSTLRC